VARNAKERRRRARQRKHRGRLFLGFERAVLGTGMSMVAFFIERRLIKAIRKGAVSAAPRTAAEREEAIGVPGPEPREGELTTSPHQVRDQTQR
jgi:hypothetical protein